MILKRKEEITIQSIGEEIANSITHGVGAILSIVCLIILLYASITRGTAKHVVSCSIYGGSLVVLYLFSTLYHSITHKSAKQVFRRLDHIGIYLLIAGTYMPITLVILNGAIGWTLFGLVCGFALIGILFKAIIGPKLEVVSSFFYLTMGGLLLIAIKPLITTLPTSGIVWMMNGGLFYVLGILFFAADKKYSYFHAIWHLFVLAGSFCHFFMVIQYVIPSPIR